MTARPVGYSAHLWDTDQSHPDWCVNATQDDDRCGVHFSTPTSVPAIAGDWQLTDGAALFPIAAVATTVDLEGKTGVRLTTDDPTADGQVRTASTEFTFDPDGAIALGVALIEHGNQAKLARKWAEAQ